MPLFKVWNKGKTIRKAVSTDKFFCRIYCRTMYLYSRAFDCGFCPAGHLTTYFFKSQIPWGLSRGGGLIVVGFDSYITLGKEDWIALFAFFPMSQIDQYFTSSIRNFQDQA